jgi:8-oxo-dGTP pyrophosphatase MutT (NUDIX family)
VDVSFDLLDGVHDGLLDDYLHVIGVVDKQESPGCLDVLMGGHCKGTESLEHALREELKEEVNLEVDRDVTALVVLGSYDDRSIPRRRDFVNVEHRTVYRGRLRAEAMPRIRYPDGEVAAVCLFNVPELVRCVEAHPERVASGLLGSLPLYLEAAQA